MDYLFHARGPHFISILAITFAPTNIVINSGRNYTTVKFSWLFGPTAKEGEYTSADKEGLQAIQNRLHCSMQAKETYERWVKLKNPNCFVYTNKSLFHRVNIKFAGGNKLKSYFEY